MTQRLTPRKKQAIEMKAHILSTALDLFDRSGFDYVSVEEIAQAAGCSVGNIYHYFKSKDELAIQVTSHVDAAYEEIEAAFDGAAYQAVSARDRLLEFVGASLDISGGDEFLDKCFIYSLNHPEQGVLKINDRVYFRLLRHLIRDCQAEGSIHPGRDVEDVLSDLVILHRGLLLQWKICERQFDIAQKGIAMATLLLEGLCHL